MYLTYDHCQNRTATNGKIFRETTQGNNIRGNILVIERSINYDYRYPMEKTTRRVSFIFNRILKREN